MAETLTRIDAARARLANVQERVQALQDELRAARRRLASTDAVTVAGLAEREQLQRAIRALENQLPTPGAGPGDSNSSLGHELLMAEQALADVRRERWTLARDIDRLDELAERWPRPRLECVLSALAVLVDELDTSGDWPTGIDTRTVRGWTVHFERIKERIRARAAWKRRLKGYGADDWTPPGEYRAELDRAFAAHPGAPFGR